MGWAFSNRGGTPVGQLALLTTMRFRVSGLGRVMTIWARARLGREHKAFMGSVLARGGPVLRRSPEGDRPETTAYEKTYNLKLSSDEVYRTA